ncbi:MAG: helix-turn-helix domain-containing protein [Sulfurifustis sp.]
MEFIVRTPSQLGDALKAGRAAKKLTQQEAGGRVGLLPKTISALESKPERSSVESLLKLLSALDLELVLREKSRQPKASRTSEW